MWIERLTLTEFRNHARLALQLDRRPLVLTGSNGAGKTNILEAVSLLAPGRGLRRAVFSDVARSDGPGTWAVAARLGTREGAVEIGTGIVTADDNRQGRVVRIDGEDRAGPGALADLVEVIWLTPAMDGLFTGPASERRRFLDRLVVSFDPNCRTQAGRFERAMRQRNRLLEEGAVDPARFEGLELVMAEAGVAVAAARAEAIAGLTAMIGARREHWPDSAFPWAGIALEGTLESGLATRPAVDVEDDYLQTLSSRREYDRAARRTLEGPHCSDFLVSHGPKAMPGRLCSTGEQKALLVGLVLAHAELVKQRATGAAPILLLDEIAAHLDEHRRAALFAEIIRLGSQAWMTGTDASAFSALSSEAQFVALGEAAQGAATSLRIVAGGRP